MSETPNANRNVARITADMLPRELQTVDVHRAEVSARRVRSMDELRAGIERLNANFMAANLFAHGCGQYEDPDTVRHVNRGGALTQILIEDSVAGFSPDPGLHNLDLVDLDPQPKPHKEGLMAVRDELMEARRGVALAEQWHLTPEETAANEAHLMGGVDEVLDAVGLREAVELGIQGLTGPGLEEPTREIDAKYGAAMVVLAVGITES